MTTAVLEGIERAREQLMSSLGMILSNHDIKLILVTVQADGSFTSSYWFTDTTVRLLAQVNLAMRDAAGAVIGCNLVRNEGFWSAEVHTFSPLTGLSETYVYVEDRDNHDVLHLIESVEPVQVSLVSWVSAHVPVSS